MTTKKNTPAKSKIDKLIAEKGGILLDIACGANKQSPDWIGIDVQLIPGVDIVHDINEHPWPLPDACVITAIASHIVEHIPPVTITNGTTRFPFIEFMNEAWRVLKYGCNLAIIAPHGSSQGYLQDPTHVNAINEHTWNYFDPLHPSGFYKFYRPKPWKIKHLTWSPTANMEVVLEKRREDKSYDA